MSGLAEVGVQSSTVSSCSGYLWPVLTFASVKEHEENVAQPLLVCVCELGSAWRNPTCSPLVYVKQGAEGPNGRSGGRTHCQGQCGRQGGLGGCAAAAGGAAGRPHRRAHLRVHGGAGAAGGPGGQGGGGGGPVGPRAAAGGAGGGGGCGAGRPGRVAGAAGWGTGRQGWVWVSVGVAPRRIDEAEPEATPEKWKGERGYG